MNDDLSVAELRAHARAIDEGLEHHQLRRRLWVVTKPYKMFSKDWIMSPELVLARSAPEARKLVREEFYKMRRDVPQELDAIEIDTTASRILDARDEEVRIAIANEPREAPAP